MSTLADDFLELARADAARERWAHFATTMPAVALPLLLPLLTTSHAGTLDLGIIAGFREVVRDLLAGAGELGADRRRWRGDLEVLDGGTGGGDA